jgi:hypothetical protein
MDEGRKLARRIRTAKNPVRMRRAIVVLMSAQGQTVRDITSLPQVSDDYVRDVIHAFKERGFDALDPKPRGRRPCKIGEQIRAWIYTIVRTSPANRGWSQRCPAVARCGVGAKRSDGKLSAHVTAYLTMAMCLFGDDDYTEVATNMTGSLSRGGAGTRLVGSTASASSHSTTLAPTPAPLQVARGSRHPRLRARPGVICRSAGRASLARTSSAWGWPRSSRIDSASRQA